MCARECLMHEVHYVAEPFECTALKREDPDYSGDHMALAVGSAYRGHLPFVAFGEPPVGWPFCAACHLVT